MLYIRELIRTERTRAGASADLDDSPRSDLELPEPQRNTLRVLRSIQMLIEAELRIGDDQNLRLLTFLLHDKSTEVLYIFNR